MGPFDVIAERRIQEAVDRGELDDLPGAGRPLALEDDPLVPEDLRMAYRILRNAGFVPPEVEMLRDVRDLERCIASAPDETTRSRALRRLQALERQLAARGRHARGVSIGSAYHARLLARFG
ncbi:MAG: DUF1992 domain-containing protein [Betaproteobacteria bacterium]|nr:DUF1992 domain-containing protein [Betaproteobacteria bacterium]